MLEYGPFWDEECLRGEIAPARTREPSLFDTDLFCDEETLDSIVPDTASPPIQPSSIPVQPAALTPLSLSNYPCNGVDSLPFPDIEEDSLPSISPWRTFMDDTCPFRRRVKVTITPNRKRQYRSTINSTDHTPSPFAKRKRVADAKTMRGASPAKTQAVLHFPPTFGAPTVPRRLRIQLPNCSDRPDLNSSNVASSPSSAVHFARSTVPKTEAELLAPTAFSRALQPDHDLELVRHETGNPDNVIMVGRGGEMSDCEDSGSCRGYVTAALHSRLRSVSSGRIRVSDIDNITCTSRLTVSSSASRDSSTLPKASDAVIAVTRAAQIFKSEFVPNTSQTIGQMPESCEM